MVFCHMNKTCTGFLFVWVTISSDIFSAYYNWGLLKMINFSKSIVILQRPLLIHSLPFLFLAFQYAYVTSLNIIWQFLDVLFHFLTCFSLFISFCKVYIAPYQAHCTSMLVGLSSQYVKSCSSSSSNTHISTFERRLVIISMPEEKRRINSSNSTCKSYNTILVIWNPKIVDRPIISLCNVDFCLTEFIYLSKSIQTYFGEKLINVTFNISQNNDYILDSTHESLV